MKHCISHLLLIIILNCVWLTGKSQKACTTLGQNPYSAFPVCGTTKFEQRSVPPCGGNRLLTHCPAGTGTYEDINPFWYKFTCYTAGTFGLIITPIWDREDYDWILYDITGHDPMDVYSVGSLYVSSNWAGTYGPTGTSPIATQPYECASDPQLNKSAFSSMPTLIQGHEYLLLVSHFSNSQGGYSLSFEGGTARITNESVPSLANTFALCDGKQVIIKLNKKMKCSSLAADGTDFMIMGPTSVSILSATANACTRGFEMDSITLTLSNVLIPGEYTIISRTGTDGNTLLDNCNTSLAIDLQNKFRFTGSLPITMDSISPVVCATDTLQLIFSKRINCNSIAADGTDFRITGPIAVHIQSATGVCGNGLSNIVRIILTEPIRKNGLYTISLQNGSDGNSLADECGFAISAGSSLSFSTNNIVSALFQYTVTAGCQYDTVRLNNDGYDDVRNWQWMIDSIPVSNVPNPVLTSKSFGSHIVRLAVSNGICKDTSSISILFPDQTIKASFAVADTLCATDTLHFTDMSIGNPVSWNWNFGNGLTSDKQVPGPQYYPQTGRSRTYTAKLMVGNQFNCTDIFYKQITVLPSCYIAVPSAFTPNGDGLNDYLYPLNAFKADNLVFRIYNRYGQIIFETKDWTRKWDGRVKSQLQPSGTYVWTLDYTERDGGKRVALKGTTVLIR